MPRAQRSRPAAVARQPPGVQQPRVRVDADAERSALGHRRGRAGLRTASVIGCPPDGHEAVEVGDQGGAAVDEAGVDLQQPGAGVEHGLAVVAGHDAADADHRQRRSARPGRRPRPGPARSAARRRARPPPGRAAWSSGCSPSRPSVVLVAISPAAPAAARRPPAPAPGRPRSGPGRA